jgi:hypothetical protein
LNSITPAQARAFIVACDALARPRL